MRLEYANGKDQGGTVEARQTKTEATKYFRSEPILKFQFQKKRKLPDLFYSRFAISIFEFIAYQSVFSIPTTESFLE
jgi:hypothetical protein